MCVILSGTALAITIQTKEKMMSQELCEICQFEDKTGGKYCDTCRDEFKTSEDDQ